MYYCSLLLLQHCFNIRNCITYCADVAKTYKDAVLCFCTVLILPQFTYIILYYCNLLVFPHCINILYCITVLCRGCHIVLILCTVFMCCFGFATVYLYPVATLYCYPENLFCRAGIATILINILYCITVLYWCCQIYWYPQH